jgi:hypothetical protein
MPIWFDEQSYAVVRAAVDRLIPAYEAHPGAAEGGVTDYIDGMLGAFLVDPPRIFAGGPFSGRFGGDAGFARFTPLTKHQELAWRTRIEGSQGIAAREFNGPVVGLQERYREGIAGLGADFADVDVHEQDRRLDLKPGFRALLYEHACEGMYAAPEYGGNRDLSGWKAIQWPGDVQPRGYTDAEVSGRE